MEFNGTFFATIITFIVFVFIMNKILYAPILGIMEQRENFISGNYKTADENNEKVKILTEEKEEKLDNAKGEARENYVKTINEYKSKKSDIISEAQNSSKEQIETADSELENLSNDVKNGLKGYMNDLADDIVEKVIGYRSHIDGFDNAKVDEVLWGQNS